MLIRRKSHETPGLNTTSTADISFMLLIFFLVTTSMDVDKGLLRQLPSPEPQKKERQESVVDKNNLMAIHLTAGDTLLVNDKPMKVAQLKEKPSALCIAWGRSISSLSRATVMQITISIFRCKTS